MKFGKIPVHKAAGSILAHSTRLPERVYKKGHLLNQDDVDTLKNSGITELITAQLEINDVLEDKAAAQISNAIAGQNIKVGDAFTGRCNLIAKVYGLISYDPLRLDKLNLIDQTITVATLSPFSVVQPGQLIATIKIIPLAVSQRILHKAERLARNGEPIISVSPFEKKKLGLIMSSLPGMKESILDNTLKTVSTRVENHGSEISHEIRVKHDQEEVRTAILNLEGNCDIILIFGASAVVDRQDVLPAAVESAGGSVDHFGMPVDPGNLLFIGQLGDIPVVGMPGCARSPKLNGFDWVLWRLLANIRVSPQDIMLMGAGGLLKEITERGQLRSSSGVSDEKALGYQGKFTALVLAAGISSRMGKENKLMAHIAGKPMIQHVVEAIKGSNIHSIVVVTGFESDKIKNLLNQKDISFVYNKDYSSGLSTSLKAGLNELQDDIDGVLICLGDMPSLDSNIINRLIRAFDPIEGRTICVPIHDRKRGNPILWGKTYIAEMSKISGDIGAKGLLENYADQVFEVNFEDDDILFDVDTHDFLLGAEERINKK